jgi:hypothetical protein
MISRLSPSVKKRTRLANPNVQCVYGYLTMRTVIVRSKNSVEGGGRLGSGGCFARARRGAFNQDFGATLKGFDPGDQVD